MFDFALSRCVVQGFMCPFDVATFECDRVDAANGDMAVPVVCIAMHCQDISVAGRPDE